jgi:hypothetical protein
MLAMTLFALLLTVLLGGLHFAARSWSSGEQSVRSAERVQLVQQFLRRVLRAAMPITGPDNAQIAGPVFKGSERWLEFVGPAPASAQSPIPYRYRLLLDKGRAHEMQLILLHAPYWREPNPGVEEDRTVLLDRVSTLNIAYFGSSNRRTDARWHGSWQGKRFPDAVRIDVSMIGADTTWLPLIVEPVVQPIREQ